MSDRNYTDQEQEFLDACDALSDADREKMIRLTQRIANKPQGFIVTLELVDNMFKNDSDIPLH